MRNILQLCSECFFPSECLYAIVLGTSQAFTQVVLQEMHLWGFGISKNILKKYLGTGSFGKPEIKYGMIF